jgi:hypothetical protein
VPPEPRQRPPAGIRFYVDEDIIGLGNGLMWLRPDVATCGYAPVANTLHRGMPDVDWIPAVAELGLVAITNNDKIRTNPVEARVAVQCGARIVGLAGKVAQRSTWDRAVLLVRHWQAVENHIAAHPNGPWWLAVTQSGAEPRTFRGAMN